MTAYAKDVSKSLLWQRSFFYPLKTMRKWLENGSFVENSLKRENTFAANVFDLYRESFFLKDGFSGTFAQEKLDALLRKIKRIVVEEKAERITLDELALVDLVGDPNVRKYFESIKPLVDKVQGRIL